MPVRSMRYESMNGPGVRAADSAMLTCMWVAVRRLVMISCVGEYTIEIGLSA